MDGLSMHPTETLLDARRAGKARTHLPPQKKIGTTPVRPMATTEEPAALRQSAERRPVLAPPRISEFRAYVSGVFLVVALVHLVVAHRVLHAAEGHTHESARRVGLLMLYNAVAHFAVAVVPWATLLSPTRALSPQTTTGLAAGCTVHAFLLSAVAGCLLCPTDPNGRQAEADWIHAQSGVTFGAIQLALAWPVVLVTAEFSFEIAAAVARWLASIARAVLDAMRAAGLEMMGGEAFVRARPGWSALRLYGAAWLGRTKSD
jgi:hypothetical protein